MLNPKHVSITDDRIVIRSPYSPAHNAIWKALGGKFVTRIWVLPDNEHSRAKIAEMTGLTIDGLKTLERK